MTIKLGDVQAALAIPEVKRAAEILAMISITTDSLCLDHLRAANVARLPHFKNGKGEPAHSEPDGSDWSLGEWVCAVTGELGEAANIIKKVKRGDITMNDAREALKREFADVICYMDLLAYRCGIDLSDAVRTKFNEFSDRVNSDIKL
jgi:NTP pyrophosphatase (non-canonical NTP hydrolase)